MPRFFVNNISGDTVEITGGDARHIGRSLRMKTGEDLTVSCGGTDCFCRIESISDEKVICKILYSAPSKAEPTIKLTLFQALPKSDKLETIVQKATELGACRIVPMLTARCVSRPSPQAFEKKAERLRKIALEASKQSGRGEIPEILPLTQFEKAVAIGAEADLPLICYEGGGERLCRESFVGKKSISVFIGSEGGFEAAEVAAAEGAGFRRVWLGERILRCETAPTAVLSIIMNLTGNM